MRIGSITYIGKESTEPAPHTEPPANPLREARRKLESLYGKKSLESVSVAWPYLSSEDRHVRWAARTALEFQDPQTWRDKALAETNPVALTNAIIGLTRIGERAYSSGVSIRTNQQ